METNIIRQAVDGQYSNFADTIKSVLKQKMASHEITTRYTAEFDRINDLKSRFASISEMGAVAQEEE